MSKEFIELKNKTIFITGVSGFIGSNLAERLLKEIEGIKIVGLDNMNDYYGHLRLIWLVIKYKKGFEVKVTSNPFLFIQFFN